MKAQLNIKEAIRHYNEQKELCAPELTTAALALLVFAEKKSSDESKIVLFYQIANNKRRFVDLNWLITIAEKTGYPANKLISFTN